MFSTSVFSVNDVFHCTYGIHLNHRTVKHNFIFLGQADGTFVGEINYHAAQH